ncbi:MAG: protein-export chaperone SecB [Burkholderiales bacterium]|nr:protein-export chaperone SecB [Burkholderiales bacterium]
MSDQQTQPIFSIEKLYVKDLSLEVPNAPLIYTQPTQPEVELNIHNEAIVVDAEGGLFEATLTITVKATAGERTAFLVEVAQSGLFTIKNVPEEDMQPILGVACPNILFPYVREVVSDLVTRAGFPPVVLAPLNFDVLYTQRLAEMQREAQDAPTTIQ